MTMAVQRDRRFLSEYDKTVSMLEAMTDEELHAIRTVAAVILRNGAETRPYHRLTEEEFFARLDEGLMDIKEGRYRESEVFERELADEFDLV